MHLPSVEEVKNAFSSYGWSFDPSAYERILIYMRLLLESSSRMNLVSRNDLSCILTRHVCDSAQLMPFITDPASTEVADIGAGAGFPGVILSILGVGGVKLIESSSKKCLFLEKVSHETGANFSVLNERAEKVEALQVDIVTARAVSSLGRVLGYSMRLLKKGGFCLFHKGSSFNSEIVEATKLFSFTVTATPSVTGPGVVLKIKKISRTQG